MNLKNTEQEYGLISKLFHWAVFLVLLVLLYSAMVLEDMPRGPEKFAMFKLHASFGVIMLSLMVLRLLWRWINIRPANIPGVPQWQNTSARIAHITLYVVIIAQAITGLLRVATKGFAIPFFDLFEFNLPVEKSESLNDLFGGIHDTLPIIILAVVILHICAAFYHHYKLKDNTLRRMTTGIKTQ